MKNPFTFKKENEFVDSKQKELIINYYGRPVAAAFLVNGYVELHFTDPQPGIKVDEWKFLTNICNHLQEKEMAFLYKLSN